MNMRKFFCILLKSFPSRATRPCCAPENGMLLRRAVTALFCVAVLCAGCSGGDGGSAGTSAAQLAEVSGSARVTVSEAGSGAPVAGATVRLGDSAAVTGADGSCSFAGVRPGLRPASVTKPGYQPAAVNIEAGVGNPVVNTVHLERGELSTPYDVVVVGAGTGGVSAAIQAARMGMRVALLEETDWIGGQMTAAGVTSLDEENFLRNGNRSGIYREFVELVTKYYAARGKSTGTAYFTQGSIAFEPSVGQRILYRMLPPGRAPSGATLDLYLRAKVRGALRPGNAVTGVVLADGSTLQSKVTIDATEYGDLLSLSGARYRVGNSTSDAVNLTAKINPLTWTAVIKKYHATAMDQQLLLPSPPPGYADVVMRLRSSLSVDGRLGDSWYQSGTLDYSQPYSFAFHNAWRGMPDSGNPENYDASFEWYRTITKTGLNAGYNDYPATVRYIEDPVHRKRVNCRAKLRTLQALYYIQNELGQQNWSVATDEGYDTPYSREENACPDLPPAFAAVERHFPVTPYVREGRRAIGVMTLTAKDTQRDGTAALKNFPSSLAVGDYPYDIHDLVRTEDLDCGDTAADLVKVWSLAGGAFQVPMEAFIPESVDGLIMAEKNLSASRLVTSAIRLQPITMMTGQAAGALAAVSVQQGVQPREVRALDVQWELLKGGALLARHNPPDASFSHPYWKQIQLALLYGFPHAGGEFNGNGEMTKGEIAELLNNAFGLLPQTGTPYATATRAEFAVLLATAMRLDLANVPAKPVYDDLPPTHFAFRQVQRLHEIGVFNAWSVLGSQFEPGAPITREAVALLTATAVVGPDRL